MTAMPKVVERENGIEAVERVLAAVPDPVRSTVEVVRQRIRDAAPEGTLELIGYGVPAFQTPGPRPALLAGYAAGRKFCSFYPMSGRVIQDLAEDLKSFELTKGAIHFPLDKPLSAALIRKLVKARLNEITNGRVPAKYGRASVSPGKSGASKTMP